MAHSRDDYNGAVEASQILFGKGTTESLMKMNENTFLSVFEGVPVFDISKELFASGLIVSDLCAVHTQVFTSKGELRRLIDGGGFSINKEKVDNPEMTVGTGNLLNNKYLLIQKGKKNYFLIKVI